MKIIKGVIVIAFKVFLLTAALIAGLNSQYILLFSLLFVHEILKLILKPKYNIRTMTSKDINNAKKKAILKKILEKQKENDEE